MVPLGRRAERRFSTFPNGCVFLILLGTGQSDLAGFMGTSLEDIASDLVGEFTDLATRFRRIDEQNHADAEKQVKSSGAWGAKLFKRAFENKLLETAEGIECLWPPETVPPHQREFAWYGAWFSIAELHSTRDFDSLPSNVTAIRMKDTGAGIAVGKSSNKDWRTRAENYARLSEHFARTIVVGKVNNDFKVLDSNTAGQKPKRKKRVAYTPKDDELKQDWEQARDSGVSKGVFCSGKDITPEALDAAIDRSDYHSGNHRKAK